MAKKNRYEGGAGKPALGKAETSLVAQAQALQGRFQQVQGALAQGRQQLANLEAEAQRIIGEDRALTTLAKSLGFDLGKALGLPAPTATQAPAEGAAPPADAPPAADTAPAADAKVTPIGSAKKAK